ncbi:hypothetical protein ACOMHN_067469 [Nucella lapillus]
MGHSVMKEGKFFKKRGQEIPLSVLAAQTLKIASINGLGDTEKLETELEDEIRWEESRHPPSEIIGRVRRRCEDILHAKPMLLFIVALNIIDCLLVIGELTLDFHHISNRFLAWTKHAEEFLGKMQDRYSPQLDELKGVEEEDLTALLNRFLQSFIILNPATYTQASLAADCTPLIKNYSFPTTTINNNSISSSSNSTTTTGSSSSNNVLMSLLTFGAAPVVKMGAMDREHYDVVGTAHAMHYASLSILTFLLAECLLKIACVGGRFLKKRMEVFDAVIILISFTLDIIFVEGLNTLQIEHYVIVLSFLLPWRVLRVLNSLIVAVMVQHRFHLKLLYKQKRKINKQLQESSDNTKTLEKQVEVLKGLCSSNGIPDWHIKKAIGQTLTASSQGGLKALSKLVFHAAESFAPLTSSQKHLNNNTGSTSRDMLDHNASAPTITIQCNGDVEQGPSNGHVHILQEESHVEDETSPASSRKGSLSQDLSQDDLSAGQLEVLSEDEKDDDEEKEGRSSEPVWEKRPQWDVEEGRMEGGDEVDSGDVRLQLPEAAVRGSRVGSDGIVTTATTRL